LILMAKHADIVTVLLQASATLAGLALVFLGMIASATAARSPGETRSVLEKARRPVYATLSAFVAGVLCVVMATIWLVGPRPAGLYATVVGLFFVQLAGLLTTTSWSIRQLLRIPPSRSEK